MGEATVHGYTDAFWVAAGILALGAVVVGGVMRSIRVAGAQQSDPAAEPVAA